MQGKMALVKPGRRPSKVPQVECIREQVDLWRDGGYGGVSDTSRHLLNHYTLAAAAGKESTLLGAKSCAAALYLEARHAALLP